MPFLNRLFIFLAIFFIGIAAKAQTYVFAQLQGQPIMSTAGWNLNGAAFVGDTPGDADASNNELLLIPPINSTSGGIFYAQPINPNICNKWTVDFEFRIFDGNGADGLAFCFLQVPPSGFVVGGGVGIPGGANGLKVVFDTYDNGCGANPEIQVYNGVGYNECIAGIVKVNNVGGNLNFIRSNNYNSSRITYDNGNISVMVNNVVWLNAFFIINFSGYMGFTSGSGALNDRHSIRNVTIYTDQASSDAGPNVSICSGNSVQIGTSTNPNFIYSWSPPTGLSFNNISNPTVTPVNNGSNPITQQYIVTTTLAGNGGVCPTYDTVIVTTHPIPTAAFSVSDTNACTNETVTVTYIGNMNGSATYNWNFGGATIISGSGIGPYQISWPTDGVNQISLTVSKNGCTSTLETQNITVYPIPTSTFNQPLEICQNEEGTITFIGSASSGATYNWNFDGGTIVSGMDEGPYQLFWTTEGLKNISLSITENGCVSPITSDTVRVHPIPTSDFTFNSAICDGQTANALYTGSTNTSSASFEWTASGGNLLPINGVNEQINWTGSPGNYSVHLTVTQYGCISDTTEQIITVNPIPTADFITIQEACTGEEIVITYTGTATSAANFNWQYPSGVSISGNGQGPITISYSNSGNNIISLTVTENSCISSVVNSPITIHAIPTSTFNLASGICVGQSADVTYTGTGTSGAIFDWNFNNVQVVSGSGVGPYTLGDSNLGTFNISLQVTENNCVGTVFSQEFLVLPSPTVDFSASPLTGCTPLSVQFTNLTTTQPGIIYTWNFGNGITSAAENPNHIYASAGAFTVNLTASNGFGCSSSLTKANYINVTAHPIAGFTVVPPVVSLDNPNIQIIDNSQYSQNWIYTSGDGATYTISSPTHSYSAEGEYLITQTVSNILGCMDKISYTVSVIPYTNVFIPNSFTPGGDGINEVWTPLISYTKSYELSVFDRWGQLVFETQDVFTGWNGKYRNSEKQMESGVYAYRILYKEYSGLTKQILGHVTILR